MDTVERVAERRRGAPGGGPLRLVVVAMLLIFQSFEVGTSSSLLYARGLWALPSFGIGVLAVSLGYSLAAARAQAPWRRFALDRFRSSAPIYLFTILSSMLVLGPLLTTLSPRDYATDPSTYRYLLNLVGLPVYSLPDVFDFNDLADIVNQNVWIAGFYVVIVAVAVIDERRRWLRWVPAMLALFVAAAALITQAVGTPFDDPRSLAALTSRGDGLTALLGGLLGIATFQARRRIPVNPRLLAIAGIVLAALTFVGDPSWEGLAAFRLCAIPALAYLTIYLQFRRLPLGTLAAYVMRYLPGIFLLSFPVQQLVIQFGPARQNFAVNILLALGPIVLLAVGYWQLVDRHLLSAGERAALVEMRVQSAQRAVIRRRAILPRRDTVVANAAVVAVGAILALGLLGMIYIALQPD